VKNLIHFSQSLILIAMPESLQYYYWRNRDHMSRSRRRQLMVTLREMQTFLLVWFGQMISLIGSGLTTFGLGVWVYERTGSVSEFAVIAIAAILPAIVISPFAGAIVDRYDRCKVMIISDACAGLSTAVVALLLFTDNLQIWHIYLSSMVSSATYAFQSPAYSASTTLLVPKKHYGRAAGLVSAAQGAALILSPALAGALIAPIGLSGIILIDFATFLFAVSTLLLVRFPPHKPEEVQPKTSLWQEARYGWQYLMERRGLLGLILFFAFANFALSFASQLTTPMVLSFAPPESLALVVSATGIGLVIGGAVVGIRGTPRRRMVAVYVFGVLQGVTMIAFGWRESILLLVLSRLALVIGNPIANGVLMVLLQTKVPAAMQGRVFAAVRMLAWATIPVAYLLSGALADTVFEPAMAQDGALAGSIGQIISVGDGRGIALMFIVGGLLTLFGTLVAYLHIPTRRVEYELPDVTPDNPLPSESAPVMNEFASVPE
jgi:MFS family permease